MTAAVLDYMKRARRSNRTPAQRRDRFFYLYLVGLFGGAIVAGAWGLVHLHPFQPDETARLLERLRLWGPATLLLVTAAALRTATWQGPVAMSRGDIGLLLPSPLRRVELLRPRLERGLVRSLLFGAVAGFAVFLGVVAKTGAHVGPLLAASILGPGALGLLVGGVDWFVERSPRLAAMTLRWTPLAIPLAAAMLAGTASHATWPGTAALWSGPWGWAVAPLVAAAGGSAPGWPAAAAGLGLAALAVAWAARGRPEVSVEELSRRAGTRSGVVAAVYTFDFRGAALARRQAQVRPGRRRVRSLPRPRAPWLAIPWRDAVALLRSPGRLVWATALVPAATFAMATAPRSPGVVAGAVAAAYLGTTRLIEPLRFEIDAPENPRRLPYRFGSLMLLHAALPWLVVAALGLAATGAAIGMGLVPAVTLAAVPLAATVITICAVACQKGRVPTALFVVGPAEISAALPFLWLALGPLVAELVLAAPAILASRAIDHGSQVGKSLSNAVAVPLIAVALMVSVVRNRKMPEA